MRGGAEKREVGMRVQEKQRLEKEEKKNRLTPRCRLCVGESVRDAEAGREVLLEKTGSPRTHPATRVKHSGLEK